MHLTDRCRFLNCSVRMGGGVGCGVGFPSKLVSIRNNQNWNRNIVSALSETKRLFQFASIPKERCSIFRLNRNKQKTNRNSLIWSIFWYFFRKLGFFV
jgi:hypothetical protein